MATCHPRTVFSDAVCSGEHGEVIRVRCGMAGVWVGEAANPDPGRESRRRRRGSSSDDAVGVVVNARETEADSDHAPLVSPTIASVSVVGALERDLAATRWEPSASFSVQRRGPGSLSGQVTSVRRDVAADSTVRRTSPTHVDGWEEVEFAGHRVERPRATATRHSSLFGKRATSFQELDWLASGVFG